MPTTITPTRAIVLEPAVDDWQPASPTQSSFSSLPIEIHLKIIDMLPVKSVLNLRAVDKQFQELIDTYARVWRQLNYRLDLDKLAADSTESISDGLDAFEAFVARIPSIRVIDVKCENVLSRDKKIELNLRHRKMNAITNSGNQQLAPRTYTYRTRELNIASTVHFLNLISKSARQLIVESFFKSNPHQRSFNKLENQKCHRFEHLTCLDLNCATFSSHLDGSLKQEFRNINNICVDQLVDVFPHLEHIHLQHYNDSAYELYQKLARLTRLRLVEFHQVSTHASFNLNWELQVFEKNQDQPYTPHKLRVDTYMFRSTRFETIQLYLGHFSELTHLTSLSLFRIDMTKPSFEYLVRVLSTRAPNLRTLSSDALQGKNLDEFLVAGSDTERSLRALLGRLDEIYLWESDSVYAVLPAGLECACRLKKRNCCFSSYDYSFGLDDFNRLFDYHLSGELNVRKLVVLFEAMCFCDASGKLVVDSVLDVMRRRRAKSLGYLEMRFKCTSCNKFFVKYFNTNNNNNNNFV